MTDNNQYNEFWNFIKLMYENGLLEHVIVIGSWAEYLYAQSGILKGFDANLRTLDIDFLIKNMRHPLKPYNLMTILKNSGYTIEHDILDETTKVYTPGLMEIEFLIGQKGSGKRRVISTNLGVKAQALRHISVLSENVVNIEIFGFTVSVPSPEAYVVHKIVINIDRNIKAEKDRMAILRMFPFINVEKFKEICISMTKKEQLIIDSFLEENNLIAHLFHV